MGLLTDRGAFSAPLPKICHTYPTTMKLDTVIPYLRKIQKIYKSRDTSLEFCWHQHFFKENQRILLHQEIQIQIRFWYIISNSFNFSWVFNNCFNKHVTILMMPAKMATLGVLKIRVFWVKGYDVIISDHDVTKKFLSHDSNYIIDVVMWPKFGNCIISMRKVIITSTL